MPEPNLYAQNTSEQLVYALDKLLSNFSQHPEVRELLQLDRPLPNHPSKHYLVQNIFRIGRGTHNPDEVDEIRVVSDASRLEQEARDLYNRLYSEAHPPTPSASASSGNTFSIMSWLNIPKNPVPKDVEPDSELGF